MKISDTKAVNSANKKKNTSKAGAAEKLKFASMVESAMEKSGDESAKQQSAYQQPTSNALEENSIPRKAEDRGNYMLDKLEILEQDILTGNPTTVIANLKEALATKAINVEQLSPKMRELLEEIDLRASIEVAKLED